MKARNTWILSRLMLKNAAAGLNPFMTQEKSSGRSKAKGIFVILMVLMAMASMIFLELEIFSLLKKIGQPGVLPGVAIMLGMLVTFVMGIFQGISALYQGKDAPWLAVLPVTSRQVYTARIATMYASELLINLALMGPAFVLYVIGKGKFFPSGLLAVPIWLLTPMLPLALTALISALLMRAGSFARHREAVTTALSIIVALAYSVGITVMNNSSAMRNNDFSSLAWALARENGLTGKVLASFPPARWATEAFLGNPLSLLLTAVVSLGSMALVILLIGPGYMEQALVQTEQTQTRRGKTRIGTWKVSSPLLSLHVLEWKELLRTPAWFSNGLIGIIMFPLMLVIGFIAGTQAQGTEHVVGMIKQWMDSIHPGYTIAIAAAVMTMSSMVNPAVATAVSREGGRYSYTLTLPVRTGTRLKAKLLVGEEINLFCSVLIGLVCVILLRMHPLVVLAGLVISQLLGTAVNALILAADAKNPRLKWMNETQAIKQNFNSFYGMILWILLVTVIAVPCVLLRRQGGLAVVALCAGIALLEAVLGLLWLRRTAHRYGYLPETAA